MIDRSADTVPHLSLSVGEEEEAIGYYLKVQTQISFFSWMPHIFLSLTSLTCSSKDPVSSA